MSRLSIEVTSEEYQRIKARAALNGLSIKDYILKHTLKGDDSDPWGELRDILEPRLAEADRGDFTPFDVETFIDELNKEDD